MECQTTVFRIQKNYEKLFTMHAECLLSIKSFQIARIPLEFRQKIIMPKNGCSISSLSIGIHLHCFQSRHILLSKILSQGMSDNSFHIQKKCENLFTMQSICYLLKALKRINGIPKAFYRRYLVQIVRILQKTKKGERS